MRIIEETKKQWKKDKVTTSFMGAVIVLALLTYLKPSGPFTFGNLAGSLGLSILNLMLLLLVAMAIIFFIKRK